MKNRSRLRPVLGLLAVLFLLLIIYVFFTREWEPSFSPESNATLYYPLDVPTIRQRKVVNRDRITLRPGPENSVQTIEISVRFYSTEFYGSRHGA